MVCFKSSVDMQKISEDQEERNMSLLLERNSLKR